MSDSFDVLNVDENARAHVVEEEGDINLIEVADNLSDQINVVNG